MRTDAQRTYKSLMIVRPFLSKHKFPTYIISHSPHPVNRRAAGVKIAGAVLTKLYFRSRVLYFDGMGKEKIPKAGSYENFQKYFTRTANKKSVNRREFIDFCICIISFF